MRCVLVVAIAVGLLACADDDDSGPTPDTVLDDVPPALTSQRDVAITFHANGEANNFICQLDDGELAVCAPPFTATGLAEGEHTFRVSAALHARIDETPAMHVWRIDATPPDTTIVEAPPALDNSVAPAFAFTGTDLADVVTFECALDGGAFAACTSPHTVAVAAGEHAFAVRAVDGAGNADPEPATHAWTVDTSTPDTTLSAGPAAATTSGPRVTFAMTSSDPAATFECALDGGAFAACPTPHELGALGDGPHMFAARAKSASGAVDPTPATRAWTVDATPPDLGFSMTPPALSNDATPTFVFASQDPTATFECAIDSGGAAACAPPHTTEPLPDGARTFTVRATDAYGNAATIMHAWTIDTQGPAVAITNGPASVIGTTSASFAFTVSGAAGGAECSLDGVPFAACTSPVSASGLGQGPHEFVVRAADTAGNIGSATHAFTVDTVAPSVAIVEGPPAITTDTTPTFGFTASDATTLDVECRLDAGAFTDCTSPLTLPTTADGLHTFVVRATDAASNTSTASRTFTIDTQAPVLTITAAPASPTNDNTPSVAFSASGANRVECAVDGSAYASCFSPYTAAALGDGSHTIAIRASDAAGNTDAASVTFVVDTQPPTITITNGPSGPTNDPTPTYAFVASADSAGTDCRVDGAAFAPCTSASTTASLADGPHVFEVRARDAAGNTASTSRSITVDTVAPTVAITPPATPTNDSTPTIAFTTGGTPATVECQLDGGAAVACSSPFTPAPLADGFHSFVVRVSDAAGNTASANTSFTVDTVAPAVTVTPVATPTNDSTPAVAFSVSGGSGAQCAVDGGAFAACTSPFTPAALADGEHTVVVRSSDAAGNTGTGSTTFVVDTIAPTTAFLAAEPDPTNDPTGEFTFTSNDPSATFRCRIGSAAFAPCSESFVTAALADGTYTLDVRAVDAAGNADATPASHTWRIDTVAPETTLTATEPNPTSDATGDFAFTSSQSGSTFQCSVDASAFTACTSPFATAALADGTHTFEVRAVDPAGNLDPSPASHTWSVDRTAPETTLTAVEPTPTADTTADFAFTSDDASATFECSVDAGAFTTCASPFSTPALADGNHTFAVRARDTLGNVDASPATHAWTQDTVAPAITLASQPANPTNDTTPTVGFGVTGASSITCHVDAGAPTSCAPPSYTAPVLAEGPHTITITARDAAGNTATRAVTVVVDVTPPTVAITGGGGPTDRNPETFTFTHSADAARVECRLDGDAFTACASPYVAAAQNAPGLRKLEVQVTDAAGNAASAVRAYDLNPTVECLDGENVGIEDVSNLVALDKATIEHWFRGNGNTGAIGVFGITSQQAPRHVAFSWSAPTFRLELATGAAAAPHVREFDAPSGFVFDTWHHYAIIIDGSTQRLFVDGVEVAGRQLSGTATVTLADVFAGVTGIVQLTAGDNNVAGNAAARGGFRDLRVSRTALYGTKFLPPYPTAVDTETVALYPMDEGAGITSFEATGNADGIEWGYPAWNTCTSATNP